jgi:small subunit ribosomal protein S6
MRIYELTFILNPSLDDEGVKAQINSIETLIKGYGGNILEIQHLGMKAFAFTLKGSRQGNYFTIYYEASPTVPRQLETALKLNEAIFRFLTVVLEPAEYKPQPKEESQASS